MDDATRATDHRLETKAAFIGAMRQLERNILNPIVVAEVTVRLRIPIPHKFKVARSITIGSGTVSDAVAGIGRTRLDLNLGSVTAGANPVAPGQYIRVVFKLEPDPVLGMPDMWFMDDQPLPGSGQNDPLGCFAITGGDDDACATLHNPVLEGGDVNGRKNKILKVLCLRRAGPQLAGAYNIGIVFQDDEIISGGNPFTMPVFFDPKIKNDG